MTLLKCASTRNALCTTVVSSRTLPSKNAQHSGLAKPQNYRIMAPFTIPKTQPSTSTKLAAAAASDAAGSYNTGPSPPPPPPVFTALEKLISDTVGGSGQSGDGDWRQVEGCWVLYPPAGTEPRVLIHFTGGAFVGAAPQLAYKPLLEALAARGALILCTPYATGFDHLATVDEMYSRLQRCLKALGPTAVNLPSYGLGHSLGSLMHMLMCSRYVIPRAGNVLMSFNNKPATDSIPFLSPFIAPSARALGPILSQLATSPLRSGVEQWVDVLKGISPGVVKQVIPVLEQLTPIYLDVSTGTQEFTPPPEESRDIIRSGYMVNKNLLLRFSNDTIDETPVLASILQSSAAGPSLELLVKTLPGDHVRPLQQDFNELNPDLVKLANQAVVSSGSLWDQLGAFAEQATGLPDQAKESLTGLTKLASGVANMIGEAVVSTNAGENIEGLADEIGGWMGLPCLASVNNVRVLPENTSASNS